MSKDFDVLVIGAGPAGYVAAIRSAQLGMHTAVVDDWLNEGNEPALGGTCLNVGCIPSKALLESSELFERINEEAKQHGIELQSVKLNLPKMMQRKEKIVADLTRGISQLFKANKIEWIAGKATLLPEKKVKVVSHQNEEKTISAHSVILATGSSPVELPHIPLDGERIVDSSGALKWETVPKKLAVIGAGVIGLELSSVWQRLGAEVLLFEAQSEFMPMAESAIAKEAFKQLKRKGLRFHLDTRVTSVEKTEQNLSIGYQDSEGSHQIEVDRIIVAVGRTPNTENLAVPEAELVLDERGCVHIDEVRGGTSIPGVYAIGDIVRGPMLAHKGAEEGMAVANRIGGLRSYVNYDTIPNVIYTNPEIAWAGKTEEQLKQSAIPYKCGQFSFMANGRARAMQQAKGLVKMIAHQESDRLLGVHIVGPLASELIAQAVIAMEFEASTEDLVEIVFAHPSLSEVMHEAALDMDNRAIHSVPFKTR